MKVSDLVRSCKDEVFVTVKRTDCDLGLISEDDTNITFGKAECLKQKQSDTIRSLSNKELISVLILKAIWEEDAVDFSIGNEGLTVWI